MSTTSDFRTRRDFANDTAHAMAFPEHIARCPACRLPFDKRVNPLTGKHHRSRPAAYCSDTCQNTAKYRRAVGLPVTPALPDIEVIDLFNEGIAKRAGTAKPTPRREDPLYVNGTAHTDDLQVRRLLVRLSEQFKEGIYWRRLSRFEWDLIERRAPLIAISLRYYEDVTDARESADAAVKRLGEDRAKQLADDLVAAIRDWLFSH